MVLLALSHHLCECLVKSLVRQEEGVITVALSAEVNAPREVPTFIQVKHVNSLLVRNGLLTRLEDLEDKFQIGVLGLSRAYSALVNF